MVGTEMKGRLFALRNWEELSGGRAVGAELWKGWEWAFGHGGRLWRTVLGEPSLCVRHVVNEVGQEVVRPG